jgi:hypothetical protein
MLKKAGIVVLGATAGMISLAPLASAGEASHGDHDRAHSHSSSDCASATAVGGRQGNTGSQLVGVNNTNIQAPINQLGVLSSYDNDCDDDDRRGHRGGHRGHGGRDDHDDERGGSSATAVGGDQVNTGDQLIGINNTNIQAPINQLGILSSYDND